ncbi:L,D-transpeptidase [Paenibacillus sp. DMB20]|uniref:L,D-transpeptidase n=1 Tax=Paenibacillus sp. DMB20 TaxID=1642570 RepID=UPI000A938438
MKKALYRTLVFALLLLFAFPVVHEADAASQKLDSKYAKHKQFIVIDKSSNKLTYYEKGKVVKTFLVATGKKPSYTPEGLFKIHEKTKNRPYYKKENQRRRSEKSPGGPMARHQRKNQWKNELCLRHPRQQQSRFHRKIRIRRLHPDVQQGCPLAVRQGEDEHPRTYSKIIGYLKPEPCKRARFF